MKKYIISIFTLICLFLCSLALAEETMHIALVTKQKTCEIKTNADCVIKAEDGEHILKKGKYFVHIDEGKLAFDKKNAFSGSVLLVNEDASKLFSVNHRDYKGKLRISIDDGNILVVNDIPLETYLESVLPAKTMPIWPDEAIKAQAVAARTYALYRRNNSKEKYDLKAQDSEMTYWGTGKDIEKSAITKFIKATSGEYLVDRNGKPIYAVTTSSSGGRTEAVEGFYYLQSVKDFDEDSPECKWEKRVSPYILQNYVEQSGHEIGKMTGVFLSPMNQKSSDRSESGRVLSLVISGEKGSARISGKEIANILNLPSTLFELKTGVPIPEKVDLPIANVYGYEIGSKEMPIKINEIDKPVWSDLKSSYHILGGGNDEQLIFKGKGRGNGSGLSAWGARGMVNADECVTYKKILAYYYPGTVLVK